MQTISIIFGENITETAVHRAIPLGPGVYEGMTPSVVGNTATLAPGIWRTRGTSEAGRHTIYEDAALTFTLAAPSAQDRIDAIIGSHKWVMGPVDAGGEPTGEVTSDMLAVYSVVEGTPSANPVPPTITDTPDGNGRRPVPLAYILVPASGLPSAWVPGPFDHRDPSFVRYTDDEINLQPRKGIVEVPTPPAADDSSRAANTSWVQALADALAATLAPLVHAHSADQVSSGTLALPRIPNIPWSKITDTPAAYSPSPHSHQITDITNLANQLAALAVPAGTVRMTAGATPTGWLLCDGSTAQRYVGGGSSGTPTALFAAIGTTFGSGDGSTTFGIPDLRGRAPIGTGTYPGFTTRSLGDKGGEESHTLTVEEIPAHSHTYDKASVMVQGFTDDSSTDDELTTMSSGTTSEVGGGTAHTNMQPFIALNFIIKT